MAQYNNHRRRLATHEEEQPSSLKGQSYMFSPRQKNPVLTKAKSLKHYKTPTFLDNLFKAKSMTLSADLGPPSGAQVEPSRPKQQKMSQPGDPEVEKEIKNPNFKEKTEVEKEIKNPNFKEKTEVEKVKVKTLHGEGKKDVYFVVKESKGKEFIKDPLGDLRRLSLGGGGVGRRRSFGGAHVDLRDFLANNGAKVVAVDMPPFMQIHAVDCARMTHDSLEKFSSKSLALTLKKEFDGVYGPAWHCIVGTSFGSFVTHSVGGFLYFSMDQKLYILLFKTTVQRAD